MYLGRRIVIYGPTGSGKTTLARQIAERTGLPVVDLDTIFWLPNWTPNPVDQFRADLDSVLGGYPEGWVVAGNYSAIRDIVLPSVDTVVWLRPPFRVAFWRLFKRTVDRAWTKKPLWEGNTNTESWRQSFFSRGSILLWSITNWKNHVKRTLRNLNEIEHHAQVIELRSGQEVRRFLASLSAAEVR